MIPLNKPGFINLNKTKKNNSNNFISFRKENFPDYFEFWFYSGRYCLNSIYESLYLSKGPLKVGVSPLICFEALFPIINNKHTLIFIDIDPETFNLDERLINKTNEIDVIQPTHLGGNPQRMDLIEKSANENNIIIIEDCAQALGSFYDFRHVGSFGTYSIFSFMKNIYSIAGGLLLSRKEDGIILTRKYVPKSILIYKLIKKFIESKCSYNKCNIFNAFHRLLITIKKDLNNKNFSFNYILPPKLKDNIISKFHVYNILNSKRVTNSERIINNLDKNRYFVQKVPDKGHSNRNRLLLRSNKYSAFEIIRELRNKGIASNNLTQSYLFGFQEPIYKNHIFKRYYNKKYLKFYKDSVMEIFSVPNSPFLEENEVIHIIDSLNDIK